MKRMLTPREVADHLAVSDSWVRRHVTDLGGVRVGHQWRFPPDCIQRLMRSATVTVPCPRESSEPHASASTTVPVAERGAFDGETSTEHNARKPGTRRRNRRMNAQSTSDNNYVSLVPGAERFASGM